MLKMVHKGIKFNQKPWLKIYIDMNTDLRKKAKINFEDNFFLADRRSYLVWEPNYCTTIISHRKYVSYRKKKTQLLMNK